MSAQSEARTYSFMTMSTVIHVAMAVGIMFLQVQVNEPKEITQVEIMSDSAPLVHLSDSPATPQPQEVSHAPVVAETAKPETSEEELAPAPVAVPAPAPKAVKAPSRPAPKAIPALLPVVENTDLESTVAETQSELSEEDIADDLSQVDQEENTKLAAVHEDLSKEADEEMKEQEAKLLAIQKQNEAESQKMAQENAAKRAQEKKELAERKAAAIAAAQAAREAELARQAQEAQAAKQAEEARLQAERQAAAAPAAVAASQQASGNGGNGNEIRALEDLRQMPGNQRPQYDAQDRLHQRQGEVAFLAYVSREGSVVNFKMMKSSGHRELDAKTLKAIKNWKFYPGQEGWVEIPFKWDLKGGPQEMPTTLRRRAQVGQN